MYEAMIFSVLLSFVLLFPFFFIMGIISIRCRKFYFGGLFIVLSLLSFDFYRAITEDKAFFSSVDYWVTRIMPSKRFHEPLVQVQMEKDKFQYDFLCENKIDGDYRVKIIIPTPLVKILEIPISYTVKASTFSGDYMTSKTGRIEHEKIEGVSDFPFYLYLMSYKMSSLISQKKPVRVQIVIKGDINAFVDACPNAKFVVTRGVDK